jgi:hypothetical protein
MDNVMSPLITTPPASSRSSTIDVGDLAIVVRGQHLGHGLTTSPENEYGGHGPVVSSVIRGISRAMDATAALKSPTSER